MPRTILYLLSILVIGLISDVYSQSMSDTSKVLLRFNEPMSREGIFDTANYAIFREDNTQIRIFKIGVVPGDSAVVLFTEKYIPNGSYKVIINNLKDKSGNTISENHNVAFY